MDPEQPRDSLDLDVASAAPDRDGKPFTVLEWLKETDEEMSRQQRLVEIDKQEAGATGRQAAALAAERENVTARLANDMAIAISGIFVIANASARGIEISEVFVTVNAIVTAEDSSAAKAIAIAKVTVFVIDTVTASSGVQVIAIVNRPLSARCLAGTAQTERVPFRDNRQCCKSRPAHRRTARGTSSGRRLNILRGRAGRPCRVTLDDA